MSDSNSSTQNELLAQAQTRLIEKLQLSEQRYADLVGDLQDVVFHVDRNLNWSYLNKAWREISGYSEQGTLGLSLRNFIKTNKEDSAQQQLKNLLTSDIRELRQQFTLVCADGSTKQVEISCRAIKDTSGNYASIAGIISDISPRLEQQQQIYYMAYHDSLTGLANRRKLLESLQQTNESPNKNLAALLYIDLDGFKSVNDLHGHTIGDQLLCAAAEVIQSHCLQEGDLAARIGGDEFTLLLNNVVESTEQVKQRLQVIAEHIRHRIMTITRLENSALNPSCSIGVVQLRHDSGDVEHILKQADFAMYNAKLSGKNSIRFYDKALAKIGQRRIQLEAELRRAFERREFVVYYQPQVDVSNNQLCKAEALMRWQHPERGLVSPAEFIPLLESTGLIIPVGDWLLQECLKQLKIWRNMGFTDFCLSINASPYQFKNLNFVSGIYQGLTQYQIPGRAIEFEITESVAIDDMRNAVDKMQQLKKLGVSIALDDFGTGYSSLSYLKHLPINTIKLDRSFIKDLPHNGYDSAIVKSTMLMAKHLNLSVVAEGVETQEQLDFLKLLGCPIYQGFLFSPAVSGEDFFSFFKNKENLIQA